MIQPDGFVAGPVVTFSEVQEYQYFCIENGPLAAVGAGFWRKISQESANWVRFGAQNSIYVTGAALFSANTQVRILYANSS